MISPHGKALYKSVQLTASDEYHLRQRNKIEVLFSFIERTVQFSDE